MVPSLSVTVEPPTPITVVGAASVTRPFSVTLTSPGAGTVMTPGSVAGAVGDTSRLQLLVANPALIVIATATIDSIVPADPAPLSREPQAHHRGQLQIADPRLPPALP